MTKGNIKVRVNRWRGDGLRVKEWLAGAEGGFKQSETKRMKLSDRQ
jgi:hypothetical protein